MNNLEDELYEKLQNRYEKMSAGTASEIRVFRMMYLVRWYLDRWPKDKIGRWVGYVQCLLIEVEKVTTTEAERNYTRPLFHALYASQGYEIPKTIVVDID